MKKLLSTLLIFTLLTVSAFTLYGCSQAGGNLPNLPETLTIEEAQTYTLPQKADNGGNVTYVSDSVNIVKVNGNVLTGVKAGLTYVTAMSGGNYKQILVTVKKHLQSVPFVSFTEGNQTIGIGKTHRFSLDVMKDFLPITNYTATYRIVPSNLASVSSNGTVTGIASGTATLYADVNIDGNIYTTSVKVTVRYIADTPTKTAVITKSGSVVQNTNGVYYLKNIDGIHYNSWLYFGKPSVEGYGYTYLRFTINFSSFCYESRTLGSPFLDSWNAPYLFCYYVNGKYGGITAGNKYQKGSSDWVTRQGIGRTTAEGNPVTLLLNVYDADGNTILLGENIDRTYEYLYELGAGKNIAKNNDYIFEINVVQEPSDDICIALVSGAVISNVVWATESLA